MNQLKFKSLIGTMNEIPGTNILIGDQWSAVSLPQLQKNGITHILNVTPVQVPLQPSIIYHQIAMEDIPEQNIIDELEEALDFIDSGVKQGGRVLIHCQAGRSRSSAVLIAYLMWKYNLNYAEAYRKVKTERSLIEPNSGFKDQLLRFEQMLREVR